MATIEVFDQGRQAERDPAMLERLRALAVKSLREVSAIAPPESSPDPLKALENIEVTLVTDEAIARVHQEFMNASGPTDVITFDHGEILVSADTARAAAGREGTSAEYELGLYIVHGLLHLRGFDDRAPEGAARMKNLQESIMRRVYVET